MAKLVNAIKKLEKENYEVGKTFNQEEWIASRLNSGTIYIRASEGEVTSIIVDKHHVNSIKRALEYSQIIGVYGSISKYRDLCKPW